VGVGAFLSSFRDLELFHQRCVVPSHPPAGNESRWATTSRISKVIISPNAKLAILLGGHEEYIGEITAVKEGSKLPEMTVAVIEEFLDVP